MKLGAVVIPATPLLTPDDLATASSAARSRHVVTDAAGADEVSRTCRATSPASSVGASAVPGWTPYEQADDAAGRVHARRRRPRADDPLLLYFTSGTTAKPKLVLTRTRAIRSGHLSTMYWLGLREGDVHLNISSPGWAKHAWCSFFAPWNAGATVFVYNYARFNARRTLESLREHGVTTLCAPPTVWRMLILEDLAPRPVSAARGRSAPASRSTPRSSSRCAQRVGPHHPRRLRPDRDDRADRQLARASREARLHGPPAARATASPCSTRRGTTATEGEIVHRARRRARSG